MSELDIVRQVAKSLLLDNSECGEQSLWDRAQRVLRNVECLCRMPEIAASGMAVEHVCLQAGALLGDCGFVRYRKDFPAATLVSVPATTILEYSTQVINGRLGDVLPAGRTEKINRILMESANRLTKMPEAMILSDARNLDEIGAIGVGNEIRRYFSQGRGVSDIIAGWRKKIEYRYWQARLREGFRFDSVRELAARRLAAAEAFMEQLAREHACDDFAAYSAGLVEEPGERLAPDR